MLPSTKLYFLFCKIFSSVLFIWYIIYLISIFVFLFFASFKKLKISLHSCLTESIFQVFVICMMEKCRGDSLFVVQVFNNFPSLALHSVTTLINPC